MKIGRTNWHRASLLVFPLALFVACVDDPSASNGNADASSQSPDAGTTTTSSVTIEIHPGNKVHPISPLIYGLNTPEEITKTRQSVVRSGGNRLTAFNWENNASNAGSDWMFQNDDFLVMGMPNPDAPGAAVREMVESSHANGAAVILTVPNVDYVAADKKGGGDVRGTAGGTAYLQTRFKKNVARKGTPFSAEPDVNDDTVYQDEFVNWAKTNFTAGQVLFDLDNEPDLWSSTHKEIHPNPVTYAELIERNTRFATAIKDTWPAAKVLGFVSYGWSGYVNLQGAPDKALGDFTAYYLKTMQTQSTSAGKRLIDYLDLHWYPEAQGANSAGKNVRIVGADVSPGVIEARVQAPRSLWDPTYTEVSWIARGDTNGPIRLISRMKEKIAANYPGTELAFTEWNYGGGRHISGALASADVLGIFGREGVSVACNWGFGADEVFMRAAFRAYRNYDGAGAHFGDTSVEATTSDIAATSVYASVDSAAPTKMVIVAINKRLVPIEAAIRVDPSTAYATADVYVLTDAASEVTAAPGISATAANEFTYTMPAQSVSVLVPKL